jgi:hypothetical protein
MTPLARAGLRAMLAGEPDVAIIGEAAKGQELVPLCRSMQPDLVLLNLRMADDTLQAIAAIPQACPRTRVAGASHPGPASWGCRLPQGDVPPGARDRDPEGAPGGTPIISRASSVASPTMRWSR